MSGMLFPSGIPGEEEKEVFEKQYPISASMFKALQNAEFVR